SSAAVAVWGYGFALVFYAGLVVRMALGWRRSSRATALIFAVLATAIWAAACIFFATSPSTNALLAISITDMLRYAGWFAFVSTVLVDAKRSGNSVVPAGMPRWRFAAVFLALIAPLAFSDALPLAAALGW